MLARIGLLAAAACVPVAMVLGVTAALDYEYPCAKSAFVEEIVTDVSGHSHRGTVLVCLRCKAGRDDECMRCTYWKYDGIGEVCVP